MAESIGGKLKSIRLSQLRPDWKNPRFPVGAEENFKSDTDVYLYLDTEFDAASVAESISRHGYFLSEPLIAIPEKERPNSYVVLEGNRRLAALKGLTDSQLRSKMQDRRWRTLDPINKENASFWLPVLVANSREEVAPILGFRHVTGIAPWDPFQQARYVASLIDQPGSGLSAEDVADLIGRSVSEVRSFYRNYSILEQARDEFQILDTQRIIDEFGVWTRSLVNSGIREYIGAPSPREVVEGEYPLNEDSKENLERVITWIFGPPRKTTEVDEGKQSKEGRVISDSRQLTRLGRVISNPQGLAALEKGAKLKDAEEAALDEAERFSDAIKRSVTALTSAEEYANSERVQTHRQAVNDAYRIAEGLHGL